MNIMPPSTRVVIPTVGNTTLLQAVRSVKEQTYANTQCLVVVDGQQHDDAVRRQLAGIDNIVIMTLPWNTGGGGYNGQYIYASAGMLTKDDYLCYLDEDNWFEPQHVENCMTMIGRGVSWCHTLRQIVDIDGKLLGPDNCESLGRWPVYFSQDQHLVDTSCYCVSREIAQQTAPGWLQLWGEDRKYYQLISQNYRSFSCTGKYTVNYRLGNNPNGVKWEFFQQGNDVNFSKYLGKFPWQKA